MNNLLIFGVGLIGGSIAIECQKKQMFNHVVAVQREGGTSLSPFVSNGMIDKVSDNLGEDIKQTLSLTSSISKGIGKKISHSAMIQFG